MNYKKIEQNIDLNDPEGGFCYHSNDNQSVILSFVDWRNRNIVFKFHTVYLFLHQLANGYKGLPEATVLEITDSEVIKKLREDSTASTQETLHHYVVSTNEDEWCEIVAEKYELEGNA